MNTIYKEIMRTRISNVHSLALVLLVFASHRERLAVSLCQRTRVRPDNGLSLTPALFLKSLILPYRHRRFGRKDDCSVTHQALQHSFRCSIRTRRCGEAPLVWKAETIAPPTRGSSAYFLSSDPQCRSSADLLSSDPQHTTQARLLGGNHPRSDPEISWQIYWHTRSIRAANQAESDVTSRQPILHLHGRQRCCNGLLLWPNSPKD